MYLTLSVDGSDTVLAACRLHVGWLQSYEAMDAQVCIIDTSEIDEQR